MMDDLDFFGFLFLTVFVIVAMETFVCIVGSDDGVGGFGLISGSGEKIGYVSEIENNGVFWHPTEIKIISADTTVSEPDTIYYYAIEHDNELLEELTTAMNSHQMVRMKYELRNVNPSEYSHRSVIYEVEVVGGEE